MPGAVGLKLFRIGRVVVGLGGITAALLGGLASAQTAGPYTTNYVWDVKRRLVMTIGPDPDGAGPLKRQASRNTYDADGHLVRIDLGVTTTANGSDFVVLQTSIESAYDLGRRKVKDVTPTGVAQYAYDAVGRPTCTAVRMNPSIYASLPADACVQGAAGPDGPDRITREVYNLAGQRTASLRGVGTPLEQTYAAYSYTLNGKPATVTDARSNRTTMTYDGFDRLSQMNFPVATVEANASSATDYESYGYDAAGNRTSVRKRDGQVIGYSYDALNREVLKDIPGGTAFDVYTRYDLRDRVLSARFASAAGQGIIAQYDKAGRMTSEATFGRALTYEYDKAGNRTKVIWPDATFAQYTYDAASRPNWIGHSVGASVDGLSSPSYDALGRRSTLTHGNGAIVSYGYDPASRLASLAHNPAGTAHDVTWGFIYNPASQVRARSDNNAAYTWAPPAGSATSNAYDGLNRDAAIAAVGGGYDARGNLASDGVRSFTYDVENRLLSVTGGGPGLALTYDPQGRLASTTSAGTTTHFLYDGSRLTAEYSGSGALLRRYIHGPGTDEPLGSLEVSGGSLVRRYLHQDRQGSIVGWSDASGAMGEIYTYGPWGEPGGDNWTGSRFRYTGQIMLPEARLYHYKARVYDPIAGRFLQTDPIGYEDDLNLYAYVGGDPMNKTDPMGQDSVAVFRPIIAGLSDHQAKYVGSDSYGWMYISKDGATAASKNGGFSGPSKFTVELLRSFDEVVNHAVSNGYEDAYRHSSNFEQDRENIDASLDQMYKDYNLLNSNCGQTCSIGDKAAGLPEYGNVSPRDNNRYMGSEKGERDGWVRVPLPIEDSGPDPKPSDHCVAKIGECGSY